jgi:hypothetical protein
MIAIQEYDNVPDLDVFIKNHVDVKIPCVIRHFLPLHSCEMQKIMTFVSKSSENANCQVYGCYPKNQDSLECILPLITRMYRDDVRFQKPLKTRFWKHTKGNFTPAHYDGNSIDVINIGLVGRKRFEMSPPHAEIAAIPFTNIAVNPNAAMSSVTEIGAGDLVYIPSGWWHKVETLQESININMNFFDSSTVYTPRQEYILWCHTNLNTWLGKNVSKTNLPSPKFDTTTLRALVNDLGIVFILQTLFFWVLTTYRRVMVTIFLFVCCLYFFSLGNEKTNGILFLWYWLVCICILSGCLLSNLLPPPDVSSPLGLTIIISLVRYVYLTFLHMRVFHWNGYYAVVNVMNTIVFGVVIYLALKLYQYQGQK